MQQVLQIEEYPAVFSHIEDFKEALQRRPEVKRGIYPWYAMSRWAADYYPEFEHPKVIWPDITPNMRFAWDSDGHFLGNSAYVASGPRWLVSLMNSNVLEFAVRFISTAIRGGYLRLIDGNVFPLPILQPPPDLAERLSRLSQAGTPEGEAEVEEMVARLYTLSIREASMVKSWASRLAVEASSDEVTSDD